MEAHTTVAAVDDDAAAAVGADNHLPPPRHRWEECSWSVRCTSTACCFSAHRTQQDDDEDAAAAGEGGGSGCCCCCCCDGYDAAGGVGAAGGSTQHRSRVLAPPRAFCSLRSPYRGGRRKSALASEMLLSVCVRARVVNTNTTQCYPAGRNGRLRDDANAVVCRLLPPLQKKKTKIQNKMEILTRQYVNGGPPKVSARTGPQGCFVSQIYILQYYTASPRACAYVNV